jgi:hypothetical protein
VGPDQGDSATLAPLAAGVKLLAKLQARTSPAVLHLEACLGAFYGALEADMPTLINTLREMTKVSNTTGIRASAALLKVTFEMVDALVTIRPRAEEAPVRDPPVRRRSGGHLRNGSRVTGEYAGKSTKVDSSSD